jgi:biotin operon repressor
LWSFKMILHALKDMSPETANGILAAAALVNSPNPGVGERSLVLKAYEQKAWLALDEIRTRLGLSKATDPELAHSLIAKTIADTLRESILGNADREAILKRVGAAGRLPAAAYNVVQSREFQTTFYRLGVSRNHVENAVKHPDDHQHLMTEGMPESWQDASLFMKFVASRDEIRKHWLLVQTHRMGIDQRVSAAWRVYLDDIDLESAERPVDVLKAFVDAYGVLMTVGDTKAIFIEAKTFPAGVPVKVDWTGAPEDHFVSITHTTDAIGQFRIGITYCIDIPKYVLTLKAHGVKVKKIETKPGHTVTQTTTLYPRPISLASSR